MGSQNSRVNKVHFRTRLVITDNSSTFIDPQIDIEGKKYYPTIQTTFHDLMPSNQQPTTSKGTTQMNITINGQSFLKSKKLNSKITSKANDTKVTSIKKRKEKLAVQGKYKQVEEFPSPDSIEGISFAVEKSKKILGVLLKKKMKDNMIRHFNYIITVLQTISELKSRKLMEDDGEPEEVLSEVETQNYPTEVRDWLTMTFTRPTLRRSEDKLHFRGVATAIRAGIVVDRIYRRLSSSVGIHVPPNVLLQMKDLDEWTFDVFRVNEIGDGHAMKYVAYELFQKHDIINKFKVNTSALENFFGKMENGYCKYTNPYHNHVHGADVTQTTHFLISNTDLILWLSDLEVFAVLMSALIHDYEHTGTTNVFHVNTKSELAYLYNDRNVLENHHISSSFRLLREESNNILSSLSVEDFKEFRNLVVDIVLATDMSLHFQQLKTMKTLLTTPENIDKSKALSLLVHCADISHPGKTWSLHEKWTNLLVEEFFRQGDREAELKLPISPLCDRNNTVVAKSQIGFIDFIVDPSFQVLGDMLDKIVIPIRELQKQETEVTSSTFNSSFSSIDQCAEEISVVRNWVAHLQENKQFWADKVATDAALEKEEERLESPNLGVVSSAVVLSELNVNKNGESKNKDTSAPETQTNTNAPQDNKSVDKEDDRKHRPSDEAKDVSSD